MRNATNNQSNVVYLEKQSTHGSMGHPVKPRTLRFHQVAVFAGGFFFVALLSWQLWQTNHAAQELDASYQSLKLTERELMHENIELQHEYQLMQSPDYIEEIARRDYLLTKPGEVVFELEEQP